jgi:hypothetical protein
LDRQKIKDLRIIGIKGRGSNVPCRSDLDFVSWDIK